MQGITKCYKLYAIQLMPGDESIYTEPYKLKLTCYSGFQENIMTYFIKIAGTLLLLVLGATQVLAESGNRREGRHLDGAVQREEPAVQGRDRRGREQNGQSSDEQVAPKRRNMSPEERHTLRQQIHDAGREVYPANR